jgi:hemolysin type calcium-binding protein
MKGRAALLCFACLCGLALAAPARGATARVVTESEENFDTVFIAFNGSAKEHNRVSARAVPTSGEEKAVVFQDTAARIEPGRGCRGLSSHRVECRAAPADASKVSIDGHRGNDRLDAGSLRLAGFEALLVGDSGSDRLIGSPTMPNTLYGDAEQGKSFRPGRDVLSGGARKDYFSCGPGRDRARAGKGDRLVGCEVVSRTSG